jgi:hypothetical protein
MGRLTLIVVPVAALLACTASERPSSTVQVRDSAGIRIVENLDSSLAAPPQWQLGETPLLDIGVEEGPEEYQLFRVAGACRLGQDRIAVLNNGTQEIRVFDATGAFRYAFGRRGSGPGEFRSPWPMWCQRGDTIVVWDSQLRRLAFFTAEGAYVRQVAPGRAAANPHVLGVFADRSFLVQDERLEIPPSGFEEAQLTVVRYTADGDFADSSGVFPYGLMGRLGDVGLVGGPLFSSRTMTAASDDRFWAGDGESYEIGAYRPDGTLFQLARWIGPDRTVHGEDVEAHWNERRQGLAEGDRARLEQMREVTPVSERFPAYGVLLVDRPGNLWVQHFRRPTDEGPELWWVFAADGRMIATASTSEPLVIQEVGDDYMLVLERDEMDVEHVRMYGVIKP